MSLLAVSTLGIVLAVLVILVVLMAAGGWAAATRRSRDNEGKLLVDLKAVEQSLAQAHALDKGWDRTLLASAARDAVAQRFGGLEVDGLQLVQVVDRPGTDADQAIFRVQTADGEEHTITLGRSGGVWGPA
jgi:Na+-transporting methylmalonyl-CoA/oxaloacetate decarboxylase gamma subunit